MHSAFYGRITDADLLGQRKRIASDPDFNPQFSDIVDFSEVTDPAITESAIVALAANPTLFSSAALHIVVAPTALIYQLGSKFKDLAKTSRPNFHVVRSRADQLLPACPKPT